MSIMSEKTDAKKVVYAESHPIVRLNSFRFEQSPYIEKYVTEQTLFAIYCNRFYPLNMGENVIEYYWKLRRGVLLYDVPEKPLEIKGLFGIRRPVGSQFPPILQGRMYNLPHILLFCDRPAASPIILGGIIKEPPPLCAIHFPTVTDIIGDI